MSSPWLRQVEIKIGPVPEWRITGPLQPSEAQKAIQLFGDGTTDNLRIRFRLQKHSSGTPLPGLVEVYNLGPGLRSAIQQVGSSFSVGNAGAGVSPAGANIIINAGWNDTGLMQLYTGGVQSAWSRREGPDIITSITCLSGQVTKMQTVAETDLIFVGGTPLADAVVAGAKKFTGVTVDPKNVKIDGTIERRGYTFHGLVADCLDEMARVYKFHWAIIDGNFQAAMDGVPLNGTAVDINSENGFLLRAEAILQSDFQIKAGVMIHSMLNPWVYPDKVINLESAINPELNGSYSSFSVTHVGDTHSDQWETISETILVNFSGSQGAGF